MARVGVAVPAAAVGPVVAVLAGAVPVTGVEVGATAALGADPLRGAGTRVLAFAALLVAVVAVARPGLGLEIRVSRQGFDPAVVTVRKGETTRIRLSSEDGEHCFAVDALRVEKRVVPGHPTTFDLIADRVGRFPFYCCLETGSAAEAERGELVVTE